MAFTVTNVTHPNTSVTEGTMLGMKARIVDLTPDSSYSDNGDVLSASLFQWSEIHGLIQLAPFTNSTGENSLSHSTRLSTPDLYVRLYLADDADTDDEVADAGDYSAYTGRFIVLGY